MSDQASIHPAVSLLAFPLKIEGSQADRGAKLAVVDACGRLVCKVPSNRMRDLEIAKLIVTGLTDIAGGTCTFKVTA